MAGAFPRQKETHPYGDLFFRPFGAPSAHGDSRVIDTAVVVCPRPERPEAAVLAARVGGLPLLARVLLAAQQAGIQRFLVISSPFQQVTLAALLDSRVRLQGCVRWVGTLNGLDTFPPQTLLLLPFVLLDPAALRRWLGRVGGGEGLIATGADGLGPVVVPASLLPACIRSALDGEAGVTRFLRGGQNPRGTLRLPWDGEMAQALHAKAQVPSVEETLLSRLRSPEDGPIVDRFVNRSLSCFLTRWLVRTPVTPNQITLASLAMGLLGAWIFRREGLPATLAGLLLFQFSVVLDHVDGELARLKLHFTPLGKWLDNFGDHAVSLAVIGCLAWRVAVGEPVRQVVALSVAAATGITASFLVVFGWSLFGETPEPLGTAAARLLARALRFLANRDGLYVTVWLTLLLGHPAWFLWALALGANLYWLAWLLIYGLPSRMLRR
jgi:phosphatidylglycerophosphate synthase